MSQYNYGLYPSKQFGRMWIWYLNKYRELQTEVSILPICGAESLGNWFVTFQDGVRVSSSRAKFILGQLDPWRRHHYVFLKCLGPIIQWDGTMPHCCCKLEQKYQQMNVWGKQNCGIQINVYTITKSIIFSERKRRYIVFLSHKLWSHISMLNKRQYRIFPFWNKMSNFYFLQQTHS